MMLGAAILSRLGVPIAKTSSVAVASWARLFIEDQILSMELAPGVEAEITFNFDNEKAEDTFLLAFLINGAFTAWSIKNIPAAAEAFRVSQAAYAAARANGASKTSALISSRSAGKGVGFVLGKVLIVDTVIWVGTMSIDGILNFFMDEEDQGWFSEMYGGWSPLGEAFTWIGEQIFGSEEAEDPIAAMIEKASNEPTLAAALGVAFEFFLEEKPQVEIVIDGGMAAQAQMDAYQEGLIESFSRPAEEVWMDWIDLMSRIVIGAIAIRYAWSLAASLIQVGVEG
tara:strand:+ start:2875 stop:3726 length:852 start_codon:yes stop_codon:yes gene_type:complete